MAAYSNGIAFVKQTSTIPNWIKVQVICRRNWHQICSENLKPSKSIQILIMNVNNTNLQFALNNEKRGRQFQNLF